PHAVAEHLAAAELALVAVRREIALDLEDERGVAEADLVSGGRSVDVGVRAAGDLVAHGSLLATATRRMVLVSPGSKRTAVPAGMSRRMPVARARSNSSAALVSWNG